MKKWIYLGLTVVFLVTMTACGNPATDSNKDTGETTAEHSSQLNTESDTSQMDTETDANIVPDTLTFVDAWGDWHETNINPAVPTHSYNWECLTNDENGISYTGDDSYTIRKGIDVSKWQGSIDWEKVKAEGYEFAFLRLGFRGYGEAGELAIDETFYNNIQGAQAAGLEVGIYFFSQAISEAEAKEEADFVLKALEGYTLELPVVYDPELIRNEEARTNDVTGEQFTKNTLVFCEEIQKAGFEPMIYSNMVWEAFLFDMAALSDYPVWYADYEKTPQTPYQFRFWQYSEKGTVDGIAGPVDLNVEFIPNNQ